MARKKAEVKVEVKEPIVVPAVENPLVARREELLAHLDWMNSNGFSRVSNIEAELNVVNRDLNA